MLARFINHLCQLLIVLGLILNTNLANASQKDTCVDFIYMEFEKYKAENRQNNMSDARAAGAGTALVLYGSSALSISASESPLGSIIFIGVLGVMVGVASFFTSEAEFRKESSKLDNFLSLYREIIIGEGPSISAHVKYYSRMLKKLEEEVKAKAYDYARLRKNLNKGKIIQKESFDENLIKKNMIDFFDKKFRGSCEEGNVAVLKDKFDLAFLTYHLKLTSPDVIFDVSVLDDQK
jgi:hypothetical protein